jgi:hypothetical protein
MRRSTGSDRFFMDWYLKEPRLFHCNYEGVDANRQARGMTITIKPYKARSVRIGVRSKNRVCR